MKNKKTASNSFSALFWDSCKRTCFIPILSFACLFLLTINNYILYRTNQIYRNRDNYFGFFWNSMCGTGFSLVEAFLLIGGVIAGIILFHFAQSKKQCNVIFSLGLNRRKIFLAKYLGGTLPLFAAVIIAAFFELVSVFCCGYTLSVPLIKIAIYFIVCMIGYYTFTFTVSSAMTAYSGNIVESLIFTVLICLLPLAAGSFLGTMRGLYTLGGINVYEGRWNFFNPYRNMCNFLDIYQTTSDYFHESSIAAYFSIYRGRIDLSIYDFSGAIMSFVYAAIIFAVAYLAFSKRRNEISGTFGRAKGLNEICAIIVGFCSMTILTYTIVAGLFGVEKGNFLTFLVSVAFFIVPYFIFKIIFGYKRKLILKSMLKRIPACIAMIAVVTVIFSTGLFGYASRIPSAEDIESVEFSTVLANPYSNVNNFDALFREPAYGYSSMQKYDGYLRTGVYENFLTGNGSMQCFYPSYTVKDEAVIQKLIEIHRSFVQKGQIKSTASDACGTNFMITYFLKNGKTVKRYYTATTEVNAKRILGLSDTSVEKDNISEFFEQILNDEITAIPAKDNSNNYFYIYSKLLKESKLCEMITDELKEAVIRDLENQTAEDIFFHKPEDELGVISFGNDFSFAVRTPDGCYENENGDFVNEETGEVTKYADILLRSSRENMDETDLDISAMGQTPKSFVVTKSMTNTVKYLTENGYIKYFDTKITASDVKSMKLATKAETLNKKNTDMLPIFSAGYSSVKTVEESNIIAHEPTALNNHAFDKNINNEITNKSTIQKVLDSCYLYGYSGNNDRIVEVTFNDGSIATYCISAEVYDKLMK